MRTAQQISERLTDRLVASLLRPGMWVAGETNLEVFFSLLLDDLAFVSGPEAQHALKSAIREYVDGRGLRTSLGIDGALRPVLPRLAVRDVVASVWAQVAWRCGSLPLSPVLDPADYEAVEATLLQRWHARELRASDVADLPWVTWPDGSLGHAYRAVVCRDGRWLFLDFGRWVGGRAVPEDQAVAVRLRLPTPTAVDGFLDR